MPYKLKPTFQTYSWGDNSFIQSLCSLNHLTGTPVAEMWLGAHPKSPSLLELGSQQVSLDEYVSAHPDTSLGDAKDVYAGKLPFLFKVLAAKEPLSIQLHPDKQTAEKGFAKETLQGIPIDAAMRTFKDNNHKPELLCALTDFTALSGFRPYQEISDIISALGLNNTWNSFNEFALNPCPVNLKHLFTEYLASDDAVLQKAIKLIESCPPPESYIIAEAQAMCCNLAEHYKCDRGVLAPLFLNIIHLSPFEAIYIDSGVLHAYINGAGLELMANSDNVIRGGLTPKHVDIEQLLAITHFEPRPIALSPIDDSTTNIHHYLSPASEFKLSILELDGNQTIATHAKPVIMLCLYGNFNFAKDFSIEPGEAIFVEASEETVELKGKALIAIASL